MNSFLVTIYIYKYDFFDNKNENFELKIRIEIFNQKEKKNFKAFSEELKSN